MDRMEQFSIPFAGMARGEHQLEFEIDDKFFESFENSVIEKAAVHINLELIKEDNMLTLTFRFNGHITHGCDRCLEEFNLPVNETRIMLVKFGDPAKGDSDEVVVINAGDHHINVAQHIYDYLTLMIPIRVVHPDKESGEPGCNPEFLSKIQSAPVKEEVDPRWAALKNLSPKKS